MTSAKGSLLFLRRDEVVGMALRVERTYLGPQFACGEGVTEACLAVSSAWYVEEQRNLHLVVKQSEEVADLGPRHGMAGLAC
jgi:hypothetical protein